MKSIAACVAALSFCILLPVAHADTALEGTMKKMADAAHQLDADLKLTDPTKHNKAVDLKSVAVIQAGAQDSLKDEPKKAKALPPDQEQAMQAAYQKDMGYMIKDVGALNADIQAEKWDVAETDFQKVMQDEHNGHKAYRVKK